MELMEQYTSFLCTEKCFRLLPFEYCCFVKTVLFLLYFLQSCLLMQFIMFQDCRYFWITLALKIEITKLKWTGGSDAFSSVSYLSIFSPYYRRKDNVLQAEEGRVWSLERMASLEREAFKTNLLLNFVKGFWLLILCLS